MLDFNDTSGKYKNREKKTFGRIVQRSMAVLEGFCSCLGRGVIQKTHAHVCDLERNTDGGEIKRQDFPSCARTLLQFVIRFCFHGL